MSCKHLSTGKIPCCFASERLMHPSILEMTVFCTNEHKSCPIYKEKEQQLMGIKKDLQRSEVATNTLESREAYKRLTAS